MAKAKPNEIYIERLYDAPVSVVWDAWTDPKKIAKWWGPRGFTHTTKSKNLKPGGQWIYTMHGPDGTDYPNIATYHEVIPQSRLVYDHGATETTPPMFRVTVLFSEVNGKTKMEMTMALASEEAAIEIRKFIKQAGGDSTWDRLGEELEKIQFGKEKFFINRSFHTPIERMFEVWTKPEHVSQWMAPTGFVMEYLSADIRAGGETHYLMTSGKEIKMYGKAQYVEIAKPHRLVYLQMFVDESGKLSRHPAVKEFPAYMKTTVTFVAEEKDQTRVTVMWEPHGEFTETELRAFMTMRAGMTIGWTGSLDKLEAYL